MPAEPVAKPKPLKAFVSVGRDYQSAPVCVEFHLEESHCAGVPTPQLRARVCDLAGLRVVPDHSRNPLGEAKQD